MIIYKVLIALAIPIFFGINFVKYFETNEKLHPFLLIPIGFGLGFGFLTQWMLLLSIVQIKYSQLTIGFPLLIAGSFFFLINYLKNRSQKCISQKTPQSIKKPQSFTENLIDSGLTLYIAYIILFVCVRGVSVPILEWDAISWIALKGKIFFYEKSIYQQQYLPNSAYPLHVSLSLTWIALNLGEWSETLVKVIFPVYFVAYCLIHYSVIKLYLNKLWAKGSLALLLSANFFNYHSTIAYRDITIMFYFCSAILLILLWNRAKNNALLVVSSLFLGFASFVKLEGAIYMSIGLVILSFAYIKRTSLKTRHNWLSLCRLCLISISIFLFYYIYKTLIGATHSSQNLDIALSTTTFLRSINLFKLFLNELLLSANWHIIWFLFLLSIFQLNKIRNLLELRILAGTIALFFIVYFVLGSTTGLYDALGGIGSSSVLSRVLLHIYPLAVFLIALRLPDIP